jgi:hypothetical protein
VTGNGRHHLVGAMAVAAVLVGAVAGQCLSWRQLNATYRVFGVAVEMRIGRLPQ